MKSLLQENRECYVCGQTYHLHRHHIYFGAFRDKSEKWGCWCYLCVDHHTGRHGVHSANGKELNYKLKKECQRAFVGKYDFETFMKEFRKNYDTETESN